MSPVNLKEIAERFGVDEDSLTMLTNYLVRTIKENSQLAEWFKREPVMVIEAGTKKWLEETNAYTNELLEGKTERAIKFHKDVAEETWKRARQAKNLPIE